MIVRSQGDLQREKSSTDEETHLLGGYVPAAWQMGLARKGPDKFCLAVSRKALQKALFDYAVTHGLTDAPGGEPDPQPVSASRTNG